MPNALHLELLIGAVMAGDEPFAIKPTVIVSVVPPRG